MAASASDLLLEVGTPGTATTLGGSGYTSGGTSITVVATTNWPTATGVIFAIDQVDGNGLRIDGTYCEFVGVVASATSITNVAKTYGTAQDYAAGATTRVYIPVSSTRENRLVEWGIEEHKQTGAHSDITADTITTPTLTVTSGTTLPAGDIVTADLAAGAVTNAKLATSAGEIGAAWASWTPTWTNLSVGNGTMAGAYIQIGKTVHFRFK
jgi:hypothetical protein